ncbi:MAG TPA: hypothetical protein VMF67_04290 [Rhizomicrobium sp.]|nr:hypothetical protein [Rhizomicrobium sp.]
MALNIQLQPGDIQGDIIPQQDSPKSPDGSPSIRLGPAQSWYSPSGAFRLTMQASDGNVVLQVIDDAKLPPGQQRGESFAASSVPWMPMWATHTANGGATEADMQIDGNFVVYAGNKPIFSTQIPHSPSSLLRVQDDGNLVIYNAAGSPVFATGTNVTELQPPH